MCQNFLDKSYKQYIVELEGRSKFSQKPGLYRMYKVLEYLGNPHDKLKYIHIAGTNGKGSTAKFVSNVLVKSGLKVGLYTSPHIISYRERFLVDEKEISEADFIKFLNKVNEAEVNALDEHERLTVFETITLLSFLYFFEKSCDLVVLETGLGGLLDSTNVISSENSLVQVITTIDMDHQNILGESIEEIALHKGGIIKDKGVVVSAPQRESVTKILKGIAEDKKAKIYAIDKSDIEKIRLDSEGSTFNFHSEKFHYSNMEIHLLGEHQMINASLAILALEKLAGFGYKVEAKAVREGLETTSWKGRMEVMATNPTIVVDGAHNISGIKTLLSNKSIFKYNRLFILTTILRDKDHEEMINLLAESADVLILTSIENNRALNVGELLEDIKDKKNIVNEPDLDSALNYLLLKLDRDDCAFITGSLYLVSEIINKIKKNL